VDDFIEANWFPGLLGVGFGLPAYVNFGMGKMDFCIR
jgi:hypothetical protein